MTNPFVEPLTMLKPDGTLYERLPHVETQLLWIVGVPESVRIIEVPNLYSESVMYLFRRGRSGGEELWNRLAQELRTRIRRQARRIVWRLPDPVIEQICDDVELQIIKVALASSPEEGGDFFEVVFAAGVETRTLNAKRAYERLIVGGRRAAAPDDETDFDDEEIDRRTLVDGRPSPEENAILANRQQLCRDAIEKVRAKLKPEAVEAALLFHCEDVPMFSKDPEQDSIARRQGVSKMTVDNRIRSVMKALRNVLLGDGNEN